MERQSALQWPDYLVIGGYVFFILLAGFISTKKSGSGLSGYFLASRNMHWIPVGASIFASNVGSQLFLGLAGTGAASGLAVAAFELNATYILIMLGWLFVPVYMSSGVYTMPEYLRERFGGQRIRVYLSLLSLILYIFTKISGDLFAGALFIQEAVGESSPTVLYSSILVLLLIAGVFTLMGGLTAVIWTDFVQTILILIGAFLLMIISYIEVGGEEKIREEYALATPSRVIYDKNNDTCGAVTPYAMNLLRPVDDPDLPWTGTTFGLTVLATWHWCTDQVMVQRTLTSRNLIHAKAGCVLASLLKILPLWLLVFPGMIARILFPDEVGCVDPDECIKVCGSPRGCSNVAYIKLVLRLMPAGVRGLMLAVMMAALMSSLTSVFNSASSIFTIDIWSCVRRNAWRGKSKRSVELEQLVVGRIAVLVVIFISVAWIPVIQNFSNSQLFVYVQSVTSFLVPPITAVFILAVFYQRTNETGAFWGLMTGFAIGVTRFIVEFSYVVPPCGSSEEDPRPWLVKELVGRVNYLHFSIFLFCVSLAVTVALSHLTPPIPTKCLHRLTFATRFSEEERTSISEYNKQQERPKEREEPATDDNLSTCEKILARLFCLGDLAPKESAEGSTGVEQRLDSAADQRQKIEKFRRFMAGEPAQERLVNIAAVCSLVIVTFIYGFYA